MSINFKKIAIVLATFMIFSSGFVSNVIGMEDEDMDNSSIVCLKEAKDSIKNASSCLKYLIKIEEKSLDNTYNRLDRNEIPKDDILLGKVNFFIDLSSTGYGVNIDRQLYNAAFYIRSVLIYCKNEEIKKQAVDIIKDLKFIKNICKIAGLKCSSLENFMKTNESYFGK